MSDSTHPPINYNLTFGLLVGALVLSLVVAELFTGPIMVTSIFVIAVYKAYLVLTRFMHLSIEPAYIRMGAPALVLFLLLIFVGFYPDIVMTFGGQGAP
ncbi:MAG: cytochrome C oxidase subunit IV family protein [Myxococcota bacterium]|jgi:heme/copper-type cytochrome/quinol oxidase subunit 4|nr:cytochrome C oxidase subunit IV family protein [Myxococcota bacterium]